MRVVGIAAYLPLRSVPICYSLVFWVDLGILATTQEIFFLSGNGFLNIQNWIIDRLSVARRRLLLPKAFRGKSNNSERSRITASACSLTPISCHYSYSCIKGFKYRLSNQVWRLVGDHSAVLSGDFVRRFWSAIFLQPQQSWPVHGYFGVQSAPNFHASAGRCGVS